MPGAVLHIGAMVLCAHGGQAVPTSVCPRVRVSGQAVVIQPTVYTIAGCSLPPPPAANGPCVTAQWITASTRLLAGGCPVLLSDSQAMSTPPGTPVTVVQTQLRVKAI